MFQTQESLASSATTDHDQQQTETGFDDMSVGLFEAGMGTGHVLSNIAGGGTVQQPYTPSIPHDSGPAQSADQNRFYSEDVKSDGSNSRQAHQRSVLASMSLRTMDAAAPVKKVAAGALEKSRALKLRREALLAWALEHRKRVANAPIHNASKVCCPAPASLCWDKNEGEAEEIGPGSPSHETLCLPYTPLAFAERSSPAGRGLPSPKTERPPSVSDATRGSPGKTAAALEKVEEKVSKLADNVEELVNNVEELVNNVKDLVNLLKVEKVQEKTLADSVKDLFNLLKVILATLAFFTLLVCGTLYVNRG